MHRKMYVFEPNKGMIICEYNGRVIHPPSSNPLEISHMRTSAGEPLVKLVLQRAKQQSLSIFRAIASQLTGSERASHHLVFTMFDEWAEYKGMSSISLHPDGSISFEADQFALEGKSCQSPFLTEEQLQPPSLLPRATLVRYSFPLTSDPKKVRKTGYPTGSLQKIIDHILPPDTAVFSDEGLELEDFDFRINRVGRYACDLRITYAVEGGGETGFVAVYTPFTAVRRRNKENGTNEAAMFSYFVRSFLSVNEYRQGTTSATLEEQIQAERKHNKKL